MFTRINQINIERAAEEPGVSYILKGSVQKTENRVRITAQLINAATGRHQRNERFDRELKDIFALQDEITLEIITALQVELTEGEQSRILRGVTTNLEAFLKILKGRKNHHRITKEDMEIAKRMYKEACYSMLGRKEEARAAAKKLIKIDPEFPVDRWAKTAPLENKDKLKEMIDSYRMAGLK